MSSRRAIVTLILGNEHRTLWQRHCRENWVHYVERHGLELHALDAPLDTSARAQTRSPAWQKLLVLSQPFSSAYEQIAWIDSDIVIHPEAPSVFEGVPPERVGAVEDYSNPTPEIYRRALLRWYAIMVEHGDRFLRCESPQQFYSSYGFEELAQVVHSGVLVLSPRPHRAFCEDVYRRYEQSDRPMALGEGEMRPLSYELLKADLVHWIDPRFNLQWVIYQAARFPFLIGFPEHTHAKEAAAQAFAESYFLHFAGAHRDIALVDWKTPPAAVQRSWTMRRKTSDAPPPRCEAPVVVFLYHRPDTLASVFDAVRAVRPRRLFLAADGPRGDRADDERLCAAARAVVESVDWDCRVQRDYAAVNLGLKRRIESGLDWVFGQVDSAIILEDDCVPDPTFFRFCEELLERYRDDLRVMTISGGDSQFGLRENAASYRFSRYPLIWGWATWRRAWTLHDRSMGGWQRALESNWLSSVLDDKRAVDYWSYVLQNSAETQTDWDYPWTFSCWRLSGLAIHPSVHLVSNVGFGPDATHTRDRTHVAAGMPLEAMQFPLRHPVAVERDAAADRLVEESLFSGALQRLWLRVQQRRRFLRGAGVSV